METLEKFGQKLRQRVREKARDELVNAQITNPTDVKAKILRGILPSSDVEEAKRLASLATEIQGVKKPQTSPEGETRGRQRLLLAAVRKRKEKTAPTPPESVPTKQTPA